MRDKTKKFLGLILATLTLSSAFAGCNTSKYKGDPVDGYVSAATVSSNGGFAVEKGDYVYFINAQESNSADNKYGDVVKGALMRISKTDLAAGNNNVKTIVPSLLVSQNMNAGIFIYDDYVYYATPTTDKNLSGEVEYSYVDFKRAKLDGSEGPSEYLVRLSDNTANYRFVKAGYGATKQVYCLYEEKDDAGNVYLKSYNVETKATTTLVKGASGQTFYYDTKNVENPNVYYTMPVSLYADTDNATSVNYNQLFCVNAAATVTVDTKSAKYTVYNGETAVKEYDFDETFLQDKIDEAKKDKAETMPYDLKDYTTYPYVNLGTIVLDGIGLINVDENVDNRFVWDTDLTDRIETDGYTYAVQSYQNGGVYFTRTAIMTTSSPGADTSLYYLADADIEAGNSVGMNDFGAQNSPVERIAANTTNTANAFFYIEGGKHYYLYVSGSDIMRATLSEATPVKLVALSSATPNMAILDETNAYLYYYTGTNGLARIKYNGNADSYNLHFANNPDYVEYQAVEIPAVTCNINWYKPEIFGETVLYAAAQSYGNATTTYNYVHAAQLGTAAALKERADLYEKVQEEMEDFSKDAKVNDAIAYFYQTGVTTAYDEAKATYPKKYTQKQQDKIAEFIEKFGENGDLKGGTQADFITLIGKMKDEDVEAIETAWTEYFAEDEEETEDEGLPTWAIVLICVGGALIIAAGVTIPLVIISKKKKAAALEAEATVNAYKHKIDTTDDKTINVYEDEEAVVEEAAEETTEAPVEAPVEEPVETEEPAQTPAEETQDNE